MPATVVLMAVTPSIISKVASWVVLNPGTFKVTLKVAPLPLLPLLLTVTLGKEV